MDLEELSGAGRRRLERLFAAGAMPDLDGLLDWQFRGLFPWKLARAVRAQRFVKRLQSGKDGAEGYNVLCSQRTGVPRQIRGRELRHGWFVARPARGRRTGTLLLDYGTSSHNRRMNPERMVRDYVVHPDPGNEDLLLGKAFVRRVPMAFFLLERDRPVTQA
jgi:hypothetical protein